MLLWDEKYTIGIKAVDMHHQLLFSYINSMAGVMALKGEVDEKMMEKALINNIEFLETYANEHFAVEEKCMEEYQCSMAEQNKEEHRKFRETLRAQKERFKQGDNYMAVFREIHRMAEDWLKNHIPEVDIHLKECLSARGE